MTNCVTLRHGTECDAALLARWPALRYDNTSDYIGWGFWAAQRYFPSDPTHLQGEALIKLTHTTTRIGIPICTACSS